MRRILLTVVVLILAVPAAGGLAQAGFFSAGPWLNRVAPWGNDTGGIIPYSPEYDTTAYQAMAADYCAHYGRLSQITSMHRIYGDFVGFVCMDRPGHIH
jgi:hypothetical protein